MSNPNVLHTVMKASTITGTCEVPLELRVVTGELCTREFDSESLEFMVLGLEIADIPDQECDLGITLDFEVRDLLFLTSAPDFAITVPVEGGPMSGELEMDASADIYANDTSALVATEGFLPMGSVTILPNLIDAVWSEPDHLMFDKDVGGSFGGFGVTVNFKLIGLEGALRYGLTPETSLEIEEEP